ncbi:MAG: hypothetical protein R2820_07245 [Cyclobacteriaceae bacterium]
MIEKILEGKLLSYSETGMEGGYLSIQDKNFITLNSPKFGVSNDCKVWDKNNTSRFGLTSNAEVLIQNNWWIFPDPILRDKDFEISSLSRGESNGDLNADERLSKKYDFKIKYSVERLNEEYGLGNWKIDRQLPNVILKDGTHLHFGDTPKTIPSRPYGIPQGGKTRVTVKWNDGMVQHKIVSDDLLTEQWDYKGLHMLKSDDYLKILDPITKNIICEGQMDKIPLKIFSQTMKGHFELIIQNSNYSWEQYFAVGYYAELYRTIK